LKPFSLRNSIACQKTFKFIYQSSNNRTPRKRLAGSRHYHTLTLIDANYLIVEATTGPHGSMCIIHIRETVFAQHCGSMRTTDSILGAKEIIVGEAL
jgi:hypothetical protein